MTTPLRRGRPPLDPALRRSRVVSVRLSAAELATVQDAARAAVERRRATSVEGWLRSVVLRAAERLAPRKEE